MRRIVNTAHLYMIVGLVSGLYYRELTKAEDFTGDTQLAVVHTHVIALGTLFFLVVLALEKLFEPSGSPLFGWFYWTYNAGLAVTVVMMTVRGTLTVLGRSLPEAVGLVSGLGHILLTAGLVLFFVALGKCVPARSAARAAVAGRPSAVRADAEGSPSAAGRPTVR
ncbi:DUF2871 domain-containing protein [Streptomyces sp. URMC 126]|uniref:DUF2871 domain-containing protein n=1 Tax=Streptomyces sp. URMC 126 TaxID=3423401 RepID=UPI003F1DD54C